MFFKYSFHFFFMSRITKYTIRPSRYNNEETPITEKGIKQYKKFFLRNPAYGLVDKDFIPDVSVSDIILVEMSYYQQPNSPTPTTIESILLQEHQFSIVLNTETNEEGVFSVPFNYELGESITTTTVFAYIENSDIYFIFTLVKDPVDVLQLVMTFTNVNYKLIPNANIKLKLLFNSYHDVFYKIRTTFETETEMKATINLLAVDLSNTTVFNTLLFANTLGPEYYQLN